MAEYMLFVKGKDREEKTIYKDITAVRKAGYRLAVDSGKSVTVLKGYRWMKYEGEILPRGGKVYYKYFSDAKFKWVVRRLTSDGKLHEESD